MAGPGVLVVAGPPCAGKSSMARALLDQAAPERRGLVQIDAVFDLLLPGSDRNPEDRLLGYEAAHQLALTLLTRGVRPVLECTYARRDQRAALAAAVGDRAPVHLVELQVDPEQAVERFRLRDQATDLDEVTLRERVTAYPWSPAALRLDATSAPPAALAGRVEEWLATGPAPLDLQVWAGAGRGTRLR